MDRGDNGSTTPAVVDRDRPSRHGAALGRLLAAAFEAGRKTAAGDAGIEPCATCAFRADAMPNLMAGTTLTAFDCLMGVDDSPFGCHHGMKDGEPTKLCAGYLLAKMAPWPTMQAEMAKLKHALDGYSGPDEVRAAFETWLDEVDPERKLDDHALARLFARKSGR